MPAYSIPKVVWQMSGIASVLAGIVLMTGIIGLTLSYLLAPPASSVTYER